jgi:ATP-dependent Clp protease ATP-binding subunit ClpA
MLIGAGHQKSNPNLSSQCPTGATNTDKYKKFIEKDVALERRFQQVMWDVFLGWKHAIVGDSC